MDVPPLWTTSTHSPMMSSKRGREKWRGLGGEDGGKKVGGEKGFVVSQHVWLGCRSQACVWLWRQPNRKSIKEIRILHVGESGVSFDKSKLSTLNTPPQPGHLKLRTVHHHIIYYAAVQLGTGLE